jgi:hypothetical protein
MSDQLPTTDEINVHDSLDERAAVEHFLGKSSSQAVEMFYDDFLTYQEDLMWMGPRGFCFYVRAAVEYLLSDDSLDDSDAVSSFCSLIEFKLKYDSDETASARPIIRNAIDFILGDFSRYGCNPGIYGDVAARYRHLLDQLAT